MTFFAELGQQMVLLGLRITPLLLVGFICWQVFALAPRQKAAIGLVLFGAITLSSVWYFLGTSWSLTLPPSPTTTLLDTSLHLADTKASATATLSWAAIGAVWLIGVFALLFRQVISWCLAAKLIKSAKALHAPRVQAIANQIAHKYGVPRPQIKVHSACRSPMLWGPPTCVCLLPAQALDWDRKELEAVFAHELAHYRRWDVLTAAFCRLLTSLFWFHPLMVWALRHLEEAQEQACDQRAVEIGASAPVLVQMLLKLTQGESSGQHTKPLLALASGSIKRRAFNLLSSPATSSAGWFAKLNTVMIFVVSMVLSTASIRSPEPIQPSGSDIPDKQSQALGALALKLGQIIGQVDHDPNDEDRDQVIVHKKVIRKVR